MAIPINPTGSLVIPTQSYNALWVQNINIVAPTPTRPISAQIRVCPFNSTTGVIAPALGKAINIQNVTSSSHAQTEINNAMAGILNAVNALCISQSLF